MCLSIRFACLRLRTAASCCIGGTSTGVPPSPADPRYEKNGVGVIYSTIRFIEKDDETFLPWARERYVCMVVNLHVPHTDKGQESAADAFRELIDLVLAQRGSYYVTYHRHARKDQILAAYPQFPDFLAAKRKHDPEERSQSDWYRHHKKMFA